MGQGRRLIRYRWLWVGLLLLSQWGCLGFLSPLSEEQTLVNNPPWIDPDGIDPLDRAVPILVTENPNGFREFKVARALDVDAADSLVGIWVIDFQPGRLNFVPCRNQERQELRPAGFDPFKLREIDFRCRLNFSQLERFRAQPGKTSVLTFYLVDREVDIFNDVQNATTHIKWPGKVASISWTLLVE